MFERIRADYKRHESKVCNPAFWAICNYRFGRWGLKIRFPPFHWILSKLYGLNNFILLLTANIELHRETTIGENLHLVHSTNIHIHPETVIGDRCGILHDVTIGTNMKPGVPTIGNDVFIGAGAKILGNITIGDGAIIAANSLVTSNVPPRKVAIGVPAKILKQRVFDFQKNLSNKE